MNDTQEFKKLTADFFKGCIILEKIMTSLSSQHADTVEFINNHDLIYADDSLDTLETYDSDESSRLIEAHKALVKYSQENSVNIDHLTKYTKNISSSCENLSELTEDLQEFVEGQGLDNNEFRQDVLRKCEQISEASEAIIQHLKAEELQKFLANELINNDMNPKISVYHNENARQGPYQLIQPNGFKIKGFKKEEIAQGMAHQLNIEQGNIIKEEPKADQELAA